MKKVIQIVLKFPKQHNLNIKKNCGAFSNLRYAQGGQAKDISDPHSFMFESLLGRHLGKQSSTKLRFNLRLVLIITG